MTARCCTATQKTSMASVPQNASTSTLWLPPVVNPRNIVSSRSRENSPALSHHDQAVVTTSRYMTVGPGIRFPGACRAMHSGLLCLLCVFSFMSTSQKLTKNAATVMSVCVSKPPPGPGMAWNFEPTFLDEPKDPQLKTPLKTHARKSSRRSLRLSAAAALWWCRLSSSREAPWAHSNAEDSSLWRCCDVGERACPMARSRGVSPSNAAFTQH
jgi:hypothetical protein